ncbi:uncharacterized protein LOC119686070 [Teleopsis dalmanni]|nr:uncharacterized protein LOC119686070 [Teleopsis dalmanni]
MRQIIRYAQLSKIRSDECMPMALDIPDEIPHVLPVNTEVSVLLRSPWVGVYDGIVTAFNSDTFTYEIQFYCNEIGTQFINDINIMWKKTYATFSIDEPNWNVKTEFDCIEKNININENETTTTGEAVQRSPIPERLEDDCINGHPTKLIKALMLLKRTVANKKEIVDKVRDLNDEAENTLYPKIGQKSVNDSRNSRGTPLELSVEFKERYTSLIASLKKINNNIHEYTNELLTYAPELNPASDEKMSPDPMCIRERCCSVAEAAIRHNNKGLVENKNIVSLIEKFSIALLAASVPCTDANTQGVKDIMDYFIEETKSLVTEDNIKDFEQLIKVPLNNLRQTNNQ